LPSASAVMASSSILGSLSAIFNDVALYCTKVCKSQSRLSINLEAAELANRGVTNDAGSEIDMDAGRRAQTAGSDTGALWLRGRWAEKESYLDGLSSALIGVGRVVEGRKVGETSRRRRVKIEQPRVRWRLFYRERLRIFSAPLPYVERIRRGITGALQYFPQGTISKCTISITTEVLKRWQGGPVLQIYLSLQRNT
jgi:hypothetical protein